MSGLLPYYDSGGITIYHGKCEDVLPLLGPVDAVITDPPYLTRNAQVPVGGPNLAAIRHETLSVGMPWGFSLDWLDLVKPKHWVVFCNYQMLGQLCTRLEQRADLGCVFTWHKRNAPHMTRPVPRLDCEFVVWAKDPAVTYARMGEFKSMVINVNMPQAGCLATERIVEYGSGKAVHPSQKPLAVISPFVDRLDAQVIVDPFMGLGTTLRAAKDLGRRCIGIEIKERYCEIAARRLSQEVLPFDEPSA